MASGRGATSDVVWMDVHMPIIAMTADVPEGDPVRLQAVLAKYSR